MPQLDAALSLRALVEETVMLVERELPDIDTMPVRKALEAAPVSWS